MKVIRITLKSLRNQEWFEFYTEYRKYVEEFGADAIGIKSCTTGSSCFTRRRNT
jgi:hypothetical protein